MRPVSRAASHDARTDDAPIQGPPLRVSLLGPVRLWVVGEGGTELPTPGRKARALLGFLLMARGRPVSRARLAALLWENSGEAEARASLRQAVLELSRTFGAWDLVRREGETLRAEVALCEVDALRLLDAESPDWRDPPPPLMEGLDTLGDAFGSWLAAERETLLARLRDRQEARLTAIEADPGRREEAIEAARRLVALDPAQEAGWRALMRLLAEAGNRAQALAEYDRCRSALRRLLDLEPSPETRQLAARLRAAPAGTPGAVTLGTVTAPPPGLAPPPPTASASPGFSLPAAQDRRLRVGVVPARQGEGTNPLALAYAQDVALELVRYRHFDVLDPAALEGIDPRCPEDFRAFGLSYIVRIDLRAERGKGRLQLALMDVSELARPVWSGHEPIDAGAGGVEEEVLARLVARLEPVILHTEGTRPVARRPTEAGEIVIRAIPLLFTMEEARFRRSGEMLAEAVTREPENAMAAAWAAQWHVFQIGQGWAPDPRAALAEAERLAVLAMSLDPESAEAAAIYGHVASFLHKDFDSAAYYLDRSLELNPHQASVWALSAATHAYSGDPAEALRRLERYRALAPFHPHDNILGQVFTTAYTLSGDFEKALMHGRRAVRAAPGFVNGYKPVLSALGHLGLVREAQPLLAGLLRVEPDFNVSDFAATYPFRRPEDREAYAEGLILAGAPKG